jgi:hypothetical protein
MSDQQPHQPTRLGMVRRLQPDSNISVADQYQHNTFAPPNPDYWSADSFLPYPQDPMAGYSFPEDKNADQHSAAGAGEFP